LWAASAVGQAHVDLAALNITADWQEDADFAMFAKMLSCRYDNGFQDLTDKIRLILLSAVICDAQDVNKQDRKTRI
jgi:hypothetical protein